MGHIRPVTLVGPLCVFCHRGVCRYRTVPRALLFLLCGTEGLRGIHLFLRQLSRLYRRVMSSLVLGEAPRGGQCAPPSRTRPTRQQKRVNWVPGFRVTQGRELCHQQTASCSLHPKDSYWDHFWPSLCLCNSTSQRYRSRMIER